jgi:hypothetical protein
MFGTAHILLTAAITSGMTLALGLWLLPPARWPDILGVLAVAVLSGTAVFLWRLSANLPQLNDDGLPGFSANDWAAPALTYLVLSGYADLREPADRRRYGQLGALATLGGLAVNVITI